MASSRGKLLVEKALKAVNKRDEPSSKTHHTRNKKSIQNLDSQKVYGLSDSGNYVM